ncbi:MAG: DUF2147 domain-containing protein [Hyphomicrobiaceae bacterium]
MSLAIETSRRSSSGRRRAVLAACVLGLTGVWAGIWPGGASAQAPAPAPVEQPGYTGVWIDHTGRGAVEILRCGEGLCGRIFWLKSQTDGRGRPLTDANNPVSSKRRQPICGLQIIRNLRPVANGKWDNGKIYDPERGEEFDVELTLKGPDKLQVLGYAGLKWLSETMIWRRAPVDIKPCSTTLQRAG